MLQVSRFKLQVKQHWSWLVVISAAVLWCAVILVLAFWKYWHFLYDAIDLAYFNQVFWNTVHGNLFGLTIHPHLSLGDHAEFFILVLAPFYALFKHPLTLVVLQTLALGSVSVPLFLIFKKQYGNLLGVGVVLAYLLNPFIQQAALFEFHILPFLLPLFLWGYWLTTKRHSRESGNLHNIDVVDPRLRGDDRKLGLWFWVIIFLILSLREDVTLLVVAWGVVWLLERRPWRQWLPLLAGGIVMFIIDQLVIGHFQPTGGYKFLTYYSYLGNSWGEIIKNIVLEPGNWAVCFFRFDKWETLVALVGPFLLLPLFSWRFWILAAFPLVQFGLYTGDARIILQAHYQILFWPAIIVGLKDSLRYSEYFINRWLSGQRWVIPFSFIILSAGFYYSFGPAVRWVGWQGQTVSENLLTRAEKIIPPEAGVVATYKLLPVLSSRARFWATHYAQLGRQQYSKLLYEISPQVEYITFDLDEVWEYLFQYSPKQKNQQAMGEWRERLKAQGFAPYWIIENMQVWKRESVGEWPVQLLSKKPSASVWWHEANQQFGKSLKLVGYELAPAVWQQDGVIVVRLVWQANGEISDNSFIKFEDVDQVFPLSQGLLKSSEWPNYPYIMTTFWLEQPFKKPGVPLANRELIMEVGIREISLKLNDLGIGVVHELSREVWGKAVLGKLPLSGK